MSEAEQAKALIQAASQLVLVTHVSPDPDAIGSLLGLGLSLRLAGKSVQLVCNDGVPEKLRFLPGADHIVQQPSDQAPDLYISVDASDPERLGETGKAMMSSGAAIVNIDHHATNLNFGSVNLVVPEAASTTEVLDQFLNQFDFPFNAEIATCLAAGIIGDTRGFSTTSVTANTLAVASRLVALGADSAYLSDILLNQKSLTELRYLGLALSTSEISDGIVWAAISLVDRERAGLPEVKDAGISNSLLSAAEARISASFIENPDGKVEVSMRARKGFDVGSIALALGGGGHIVAAGCTVDGPLEVAVSRVLQMLKIEISHSKG
jgi:phosphoesterase RecJ-like protein